MAPHFIRRIAVLHWLMAASLLLCVAAAVSAAAAPFSDASFADTVPTTTAATNTTPSEEVEVNQHVGRIAAIFFSVFGGVWIILSFCIAYVFICVCPERYTK